jgi:hypothetical protein
MANNSSYAIGRLKEDVMSGQDGVAGSSEARDVSLTRRALIRAGWVIPAVLVVSLPSAAFADYTAPPSGGGGGGLPDPSVSTGPGGLTVTVGGTAVTAGGGGVTVAPSQP